MELLDIFDINLGKKEILSFIGAGGKTTSIFKLSNKLKNEGKKVLITTTTAIYHPGNELYDKLFIDKSDSIIYRLSNIKESSIVIIGREVSKENKLLGLKKEIIEEIYSKNIFDYILVEADGSKRKTIKCPAEHEPVIPNNTKKVIGVIGLDAIGMRVNDYNVHRPELFKKVTGRNINEIINEETIIQLIISNKGLFKGVDKKCKKYILLNKMDSKAREKSSIIIAENLLKSDFKFDGLIAVSMKDEAKFLKWRGKRCLLE